MEIKINKTVKIELSEYQADRLSDCVSNADVAQDINQKFKLEFYNLLRKILDGE
jgi:hypothetical protein